MMPSVGYVTTIGNTHGFWYKTLPMKLKPNPNATHLAIPPFICKLSWGLPGLLFSVLHLPICKTKELFYDLEIQIYKWGHSCLE